MPLQTRSPVIPAAVRRHGAAFLALTALAWSALAATAQAQAPSQALIDAAKREGRIVVYIGAGSNTNRPIAAMFEKTYGIPVEVVDGRPSAIRERIRSEFTTGRTVGDVTVTGQTTAILEKADGVFQPYGDLVNIKKLIGPETGDGTLLPTGFAQFGILVNNDLVKPGDEPKSWQDLLDPKWKGKILSDDPRTSGGGFVAFSVLYEALGRAFHERLAAQNLQFSSDVAVAERRIAAGEFPLYIPFPIGNVSRVAGLPVRAVAPTEGAPYVGSTMAMLKNAPHPNAARLYLDFVLSDPVQDFIANQGQRSATGRVPTTAGPDLARLTASKLLGTTAPDRQDELMATLQAIYK